MRQVKALDYPLTVITFALTANEERIFDISESTVLYFAVGNNQTIATAGKVSIKLGENDTPFVTFVRGDTIRVSGIKRFTLRENSGVGPFPNGAILCSADPSFSWEFWDRGVTS